MTPYTTRQIETANLLKGVSPETVDEVVALVGEAEKGGARAQEDTERRDTADVIKLKLLEETDWRKRAALSAMLISRSFD